MCFNFEKKTGIQLQRIELLCGIVSWCVMTLGAYNFFLTVETNVSIKIIVNFKVYQ